MTKLSFISIFLILLTVLAACGGAVADVPPLAVEGQPTFVLVYTDN